MSRLSLSKVNVGNLLVCLGVGWLGFSFWLPYATAARVYRIESRTSALAEQFEKVATKMVEIDWKNDELRDQVLASVNAAGGSTNPSSSLHLRAATPPPNLRARSFLFEGKHYLYLLTNTPKKLLGADVKIKKPDGKEVPHPSGETQPGDTPPPVVPRPAIPPPGGTRVPLPEDIKYPFEVYAWPKMDQIGARTVFFNPSDGRAAFTRNLAGRYVGMKHTPQPGDGRKDIDTEKHHNDYRGHDDERWIYQPRPPTK